MGELMTPEEKKVVQAALYLRYCIDAGTAGDPPRIGRLLDAVEDLIFACPQCNTARHQCPGCGAGVAHGDAACPDCEPMPPLNVPASTASVNEPFPEELSSATVELLAAVGPFHQHEPEWAAAEWRWVLPGDRVRLRTQEAEVTAVYAGQWHAAIESRQGENGRWWDTLTPWRHTEVTVRLAHMNGKALTFPPSGPVEILCDAERSAILLLQSTSGAETVAWPAAAREWNAKALEGAAQVTAQHRAAAMRQGPRERGSVWVPGGHR